MGKKLYIGNLPYSATEQDLSGSFSQCGTVESVRIVMDRDSGRSKGFAFVEMSSDEEAQKVISDFDGAEFNGRTLKISEARPQEPRTGGPGGGGGGFRSGSRGPGGGGGGFRGGSRGGSGPRGER